MANFFFFFSLIFKTLQDHASESKEGQEILVQLNQLWDQVKDIDLATIPDPLQRIKNEAQAAHLLQPKDKQISSPMFGDYDARYLESQYWNSPRKKPFIESGNENLRKWQRDVSSALESINQEIVEIRRRHGVPVANLESGGEYDLPLIQGAYYYGTPYNCDDNTRIYMPNPYTTGPDRPDLPPPPPSNYVKYRVIQFFSTLLWGTVKHFTIDAIVVAGIVAVAKLSKKKWSTDMRDFWNRMLLNAIHMLQSQLAQ